MATAANYNLSANIYIANPVTKYRGPIRPQAAGNYGPTILILGTTKCAANGTIVHTNLSEVFHAKGVNLTDTDEMVQTSTTGGDVTFNTVTTGDTITYKIIGRT